MEFVKIPAGSFIMGCSPGDTECYHEEKPAHRVVITRAFEIGKSQVTQADYEAIMATNPSYSQGPNLPVEGVSWDDAQRFVRRSTPSETAIIIACRQRRSGNTRHAPEIIPAGTDR
jgi:formylglycine-generating enzyme required for sulfatase activity